MGNDLGLTSPVFPLNDQIEKEYPKLTSEGKVADDIIKQIPDTISESLLRKTKEMALKIYDLFNELGEDRTKRIKTFTATTLTKLSQDDINHVLAKVSNDSRSEDTNASEEAIPEVSSVIVPDSQVARLEHYKSDCNMNDAVPSADSKILEDKEIDEFL
ncbi:11632_t:CDS:2, partial [Acaulospora colombiana]